MEIKTLTLKFKTFTLNLTFFLSLIIGLNSCDGKLGSGLGGSKNGELRLSFSNLFYEQTKSFAEIPDTNYFLLTIKDNNGKIIYDGEYGDCRESIDVAPGSYTVRVISEEFDKPEFSCPQYGDEQVVVISSGDVMNVSLLCTQLNSGVKLKISPNFLSAYPNGVLFLKSAEGKLMYSYSERRVAYFQPGSISLILSENYNDKVLLTRFLDPREVLSLKVNVSASEKQEHNELTVSVDTSRFWLEESYTIGGASNPDAPSDDYENALSINQAKASIGEEDVWVSAYIVGGDLSSTKINYKPPFKSESNIAIAARSSVTARSYCIAVSLPAGDVRDALNLVSNPSLIGKHIYLKGDIVESYFGLVGLKNISEYVIR